MNKTIHLFAIYWFNLFIFIFNYFHIYLFLFKLISLLFYFLFLINFPFPFISLYLKKKYFLYFSSISFFRQFQSSSENWHLWHIGETSDRFCAVLLQNSGVCVVFGIELNSVVWGCVYVLRPFFPYVMWNSCTKFFFPFQSEGGESSVSGKSYRLEVSF